MVTIAARAWLPRRAAPSVPPVTSADASLGRLQEVGDGVWAYVQPEGGWWVNNTGFLAGDDHVVAIDACATERRTRAFQAAIASVADADVRTLVNTHHHGDHTFGNCFFTGAEIVAHEAVPAGIAAWGEPWAEPVWTPVEWGAVELSPPTTTFVDQVVLEVDRMAAHVRHLGGVAHTAGDAVVHLPDQGVVFTGDLLFHGGAPFALQGSVAGWLGALERLAALGAHTLVPGHGAVCGPEVIDDVAGYLRWVQGLARESLEAGVTALEAARTTDAGRFGDLLDPERLVGNLHRARAEAGGDAVDARAALADMVALHGGPLPTAA